MSQVLAPAKNSRCMERKEFLFQHNDPSNNKCNTWAHRPTQLLQEDVWKWQNLSEFGKNSVTDLDCWTVCHLGRQLVFRRTQAGLLTKVCVQLHIKGLKGNKTLGSCQLNKGSSPATWALCDYMAAGRRHAPTVLAVSYSSHPSAIPWCLVPTNLDLGLNYTGQNQRNWKPAPSCILNYDQGGILLIL